MMTETRLEELARLHHLEELFKRRFPDVYKSAMYRWEITPSLRAEWINEVVEGIVNGEGNRGKQKETESTAH